MFPLHFPVGAVRVILCFESAILLPTAPIGQVQSTVWVRQQSRATGIIIHPPTPRNICARLHFSPEIERVLICHPQQSGKRTRSSCTRISHRAFIYLSAGIKTWLFNICAPLQPRGDKHEVRLTYRELLFATHKNVCAAASRTCSCGAEKG